MYPLTLNIAISFNQNYLFSLLRSCQLFFAMFIIDTTLESNKGLILLIKRNGSNANFFKAFFQSAPQFILQLYISLTNGFFCKLLQWQYSWLLLFVFELASGKRKNIDHQTSNLCIQQIFKQDFSVKNMKF